MSFTDFIYDLSVELEKNPTKGLKALRRVVKKYDKFLKAQARDQQDTRPSRSSVRAWLRGDDDIPF